MSLATIDIALRSGTIALLLVLALTSRRASSEPIPRAAPVITTRRPSSR